MFPFHTGRFGLRHKIISPHLIPWAELKIELVFSSVHQIAALETNVL